MLILLTTAVLLILSFLYLRYFITNHWTGHPLYDARIQQKRITVGQKKDQLLKKLLSGSEDLHTPEREAILLLNSTELLQKLQLGNLSASSVLDAYRSRAMAATLNHNCVTEFIEEAEIWATELDSTPTEKRGPLHGLPISVKDNVGVRGYDATVGIAKFLHSPSHDDAVIVKVLRSLGAVPFCKTNIPQTMLSYGCANPVWGQTTNPHNPTRSPGGSSGGEGSLIGYGGSIAGIGSDIGGSARIPAGFCGVASIKPTAGRMSYHGFKKSVKGVVGIDSVPGIMARDVETVITLSKNIFGNKFASDLDPLTPTIPWNEKVLSSRRPLKIGYYLEDEFIPATPGMKRAVKEAVAAMKEAGHEVVPFRPSDIEDLTILSIKLLQADGGSYFKKVMLGERVEGVLRLTKFPLYLPRIIQSGLAKIVNLMSPRIAKVFHAAGGRGLNKTGQLWAAVNVRDEYKRILVETWRKEGIDLVICPAFACPAPEIGLESRLTPLVSYTIIYNILNFPAGIVPVSKESTEDQEDLKNYPTNDKLLQLIAQTTKGATGMPLAVQVVGLPWQEELVLRGMREIENGVKNGAAQ